MVTWHQNTIYAFQRWDEDVILMGCRIPPGGTSPYILSLGAAHPSDEVLIVTIDMFRD